MVFPKHTVYLAGPITGLTHDEARWGWREKFSHMLLARGFDHIFCSSPMRGTDFLKESGVLSSGYDYPKHALSTPAGITTRDHNDVMTCGAMVACFLESENRPSLGTAAEYGYAWAYRKPVITVGPEDEVNVRHLMLQHMTGFRVDTLDEAAVIIGSLLTPGL